MPPYHIHNNSTSIQRRDRHLFIAVFVAVCTFAVGWSLWFAPHSSVSPAQLVASQDGAHQRSSSKQSTATLTSGDGTAANRKTTVGAQPQPPLRLKGSGVSNGGTASVGRWIDAPPLRLPSFYPVRPIEVAPLLEFLDSERGNRCRVDVPATASASLTDISADYKSCLRTMFRGAYGDAPSSLLRGEAMPMQSSAWTGSTFRLPSAVGLVLLLRHHHQPDTVQGLQNTNVVNASDRGWSSFIREDVGPDELRGVATLRVATSTDSSDVRFVVPLGFMYLGYHAEGHTDEYLSFVHLAHPFPPSSVGVDSNAYVTLDQLHVVHEYDHYWALNEHQATALHHIHRDVVRWDLAASAARPSTTSPPRLGGNSADRGRAARPHLPLCRGAPSERAVYAVQTQQSPTHASLRVAPLRYEPIRGATLFAATGVGCRYEPYSTAAAPSTTLIAAVSAWQPPRPRLDSGNKCNGLRILFTGDSQIRSLYHHWVAVLDNEPVALHKVFNVTALHRRGARVGVGRCAPAVTLPSSSFLWDAYLSRWARWSDADIRDMALHFDVMVLGFGSWPASYGQFTLSDVRRRLERVAAVAVQLAAHHGVTVVYAGSPAWPKHRKHSPGFRITNTRLSVYNAMAASALQSSLAAQLLPTSMGTSLVWPSSCGDAPTSAAAAWQRRSQCREVLQRLVRFLPLFDLSITMPHLRRSDGMHYDGSVVMFGAVDALGTILQPSSE